MHGSLKTWIMTGEPVAETITVAGESPVVDVQPAGKFDGPLGDFTGRVGDVHVHERVWIHEFELRDDARYGYQPRIIINPRKGVMGRRNCRAHEDQGDCKQQSKSHHRTPFLTSVGISHWSYGAMT